MTEMVSDARYPLLSNADQPVYPRDGRCPVCGSKFVNGIAYLSAGSLHLTEDKQDSIHTDRELAFFSIGFHGRGDADSSGVELVKDLHGGQFDFNWCSLSCMRTWFFDLFDCMEREMDKKSRNS